MKRNSTRFRRREAKLLFTQKVLLDRVPLHCLATELRKVFGLDKDAELL